MRLNESELLGLRAIARQDWDAYPESQYQYNNDFEDYLAYRKAVKQGQVKSDGRNRVFSSVFSPADIK
jgi:hypothetical protein